MGEGGFSVERLQLTEYTTITFIVIALAPDILARLGKVAGK